MKKQLTIAALLLVQSVGAQQFHFTGSISGMADENLRVQWPADYFGNTQEKELPVSNATFNYSFSIPTSGWMHLNYHDKDLKLYLWKEATTLDLAFEADFLDDTSTTTLTGDNAAIHYFVTHIHRKFGERLSVEWLNGQAASATNIDGMEMELFALRNDILHVLEQRKETLPAAFVSAYKNHITYYYYLALFKFSEQKTKASNIPKATEIPKVLIEQLDWNRMNKSSELDSEFFRHLLIQYVQYNALAQQDFMKFSDKQALVQASFNLARKNLKGESLQYFIAKTMLANAPYMQPSLLRQMSHYLQQTPAPDTYLTLVNDSLSTRLQAKDDEVEIALTKGQVQQKQIDVEVVGLNGKAFRLSDLKGKVVYLDIWASWCGPCRKQFPAAKALKEQLSKKEKKNIEFLYISIDNTETVWKLAVKELGIEGVHGISKGGWGSEVTAKFGVNSIPRYLIFDKKGNLVDGNAPRPSDPRLLQLLQKLAAQ